MDRVTLTHPDIPDHEMHVHPKAVKEWLKSGWQRVEDAIENVGRHRDGPVEQEQPEPDDAPAE